ncbi:MAG: hypothetical protein HIU90_04065 [Proteobacteria bacterium]|nr:hypothetical protein [Pseudomonadota bacterium]
MSEGFGTDPEIDPAEARAMVATARILKPRTPEQAAVDRMLERVNRAFDLAIARAERFERAGTKVVDLATRRHRAKRGRGDGDVLT